MTTLLSKCHRILEKGTMEFRLFGENLNGQRFQGFFIMPTKAVVKYLENGVTKTQGSGEGKWMVKELVALLSQRAPPPPTASRKGF